MIDTISSAKGIERHEWATPREFEKSLLGAGLPVADIGKITRFFEQARYGHKDLSADDERCAIECLQAIANACEHPN